MKHVSYPRQTVLNQSPLHYFVQLFTETIFLLGSGEGNHKKMTRRQSSPPVYKQAKAPSQVWQKLCSVTVNDAWHLMLDIDLESWREGRSSIPGLYLNFTFVQANFIQWNGQILGPRLREHNPGPETAGM